MGSHDDDNAALPDAPLDDDELLAASREVDMTLLEWSLSLTWQERLRACTAATAALERMKARRGV